MVIFLLACGGCDDACRVGRARAALPGDLDGAISEVAQVGDPVVRAAILLEIVDDASLTLTATQITTLCQSAPNAATRAHCSSRFTRPHLQFEHHWGSPGGAAGQDR
jgi:hypothetical protein